MRAWTLNGLSTYKQAYYFSTGNQKDPQYQANKHSDMVKIHYLCVFLIRIKMSGLLEDKAHMNNERLENSRLLLTSTNYILLALVTFENSTHLNVLMPITYWKHHSLKSKDVVIVSNTATAPRYINWETLTIMNSNLRWYSCKKLNLDIEWFWNTKSP